jgi:hypothetical protein
MSYLRVIGNYQAIFNLEKGCELHLYINWVTTQLTCENIEKDNPPTNFKFIDWIMQ